jgi:hypothetical protein
MAKIINEDLVFVQLQIKDSIKVKVLRLLVKLLLHFEADVVPVAGSDRLVPQLKSEGQNFSKENELALKEFEDGPGSDIFVHVHELVVVVDDTGLDFIDVEFVKGDVFPDKPFLVKLVLQFPNLSQKLVFTLHLGQFYVLLRIVFEDLKAGLHVLLLLSQFGAGVLEFS